MIVIGLTGSIGTGKSTVTKQFATLGAATLDSDRIVHKLLSVGGEAVARVAELFPETYEQGAINRQKLGTEVFGHPDKLKRLEAVVHPLVRKAQNGFIRAARKQGKKIVVLDIPLLFETGGEKRCDFTVVTVAPLSIQRQRVLKRPRMTEEKFARILAAQMPTTEKAKRGDFIVSTGLGKSASLTQVKRIWYRLTRRPAKK